MMRSLITNLRIELTLRKKLISTYVYFLVMLTIAFLVAYFTGGGFEGISVSLGNSSKVLLNGTFALHNAMFLISLFGMLFISPIFGRAVCRDYEARIDQIVLSTPVHRIGFYLGRFLGATLVSIFIFSGIGIGYLLATKLSLLQASLVGPTHLSYYALPYLTIIIPNIIIFGSIFFAVAALSRRMSSVYVIGILLYLGYLFSSGFTDRIEYRTLRGLIDPFGSTASTLLTEYWSPLEQDTRLITLSGILLANRLVWLSFSVVMLALGLRFAQKPWSLKSREKDDAAPEVAAKVRIHRPTALEWSPLAFFRLLGRQLRFESKAAFKNIYFISLTLAGLVFILTTAQHMGEIFGTRTWPVTYNILGATVGTFALFLSAILIFYTGELLWRERQSHINQILDALPQPAWLPLIGKFLALQLIILALLSICGLTSMAIQLAQGYTKFEIDQMLGTLFLIAYPRYLILSSFFFAIHVLVDNKYLGHTLCTAFLLAQVILPLLDFSQAIYLPGAVPGSIEYSDMNGYGPFLPRIRAMQLYWGLGGLLALIVAYLFWPYGTDSAMAMRRRLAGQRFTRPLAGLTSLVVLAFVAQGSFVYYNTHVLTEYKSKAETQEAQANYEKTYKADWEKREQLQYVATHVKADIFPEKQALKSELLFTLQNKSQEPIQEIFLHLPLDPDQFTLEFDRPAEIIHANEDRRLRIYRFQEPVAPQAEVRMTYRTDYRPRGYAEKARETDIVENGSFFNNNDFFPVIGYDPDREIALDKEREKFGLKPKPRANPIDDQHALRYTYIGKSGNWIDFSATVSTSPDQIAIAPGYLQKEWTEGGRRYYEYKMDRKILNFWAILSARYEVKRDHWNDVAIEVYYHKGHEYNIDTMIEATKKGLEYFSKAFGPYQHRQFRIMEFPRYASFAQSFPNTVPFSESIGFIAKVDTNDPDDMHYPFLVTAHELAHQWWAHQLVGGDVQGSTLLSETLSEYSSIMVLEKTFGREQVEKYLRYQGRGYLSARASEPKREWPLVLNENQGYLHYSKGAIIMYALKDAVGEDKLNAAIHKFTDSVRYQEPPFTTSVAFVESLKADLGPQHGPLMDELFHQVTLYDNRIQSHQLTENADGSVTVDLEILGRKIDVDEKGAQKDVDFALNVEIGGHDAADKLLPGSRHLIKTGVNKVQLKFAQKPKSIWLDPMHMWIDLNHEDNRIKL
jgi:ABC-type transport system involved in multi-copper enzyme maturation permease subunit